MNRKALVILLVFGLLVGIVGRVPRVKAAVYEYAPAYGNIVVGGASGVMFIANSVRASWTTYYLKALVNWTYGLYGGAGGMSSGYVTVDGQATENYACNYIYCYSGGWIVENASIVFTQLSAGPHDLAWNMSSSLDGKSITYIGSVPGYDASAYGYGYPGGSEYGPGVWPTQGPPLAVTIDSGPTAIDLVDGGTWHATATGGAPGYTYGWAYQLSAMGGYFTAWPNTGQSFTHIFPAGTWIIQVRATDSLGGYAYADITVTAATIAGSYQAHLVRSGSYGQYMSVYVTDAAGDFVTISSTASTQFGIYATSGGAFGWVAADNEAVQFSGYTWRWTMSANFGGATGPPPPDFWFQSSIHLAIPNLNLLVMHHFTGTSETVAPWFPPGDSGTTVSQVVPETPPVPTSTVPDWLVPLRNFFIEIFQYLFVPSSSAFSSQLASGWILIDSPVPSITPQYTIPFPNPNHLLAPTGDSVNIDFSGIQAYSGYSTYKTIVQVVLDAILVFIVISLVT